MVVPYPVAMKLPTASPPPVVAASHSSYEIRLAKPNHLLDVLRIMRENFYHEETMFKSLCSNVAIDNDERRRIDEFFDGSIVSGFENSPCLVAVRKDTTQLVGACVTALSANPSTGSSKDGLATIFATGSPIPPLARKYVEYLTTMNDEANIFARYPKAQVVWELYAVAIDKDHRRLGLAKDLMNAGVALARTAQVSLVFGVFTSIYSKKSAEKVGMKSVTEFDLSKYVDASGESVFKNTEPHNIVSVMVLEL